MLTCSPFIEGKYQWAVLRQFIAAFALAVSLLLVSKLSTGAEAALHRCAMCSAAHGLSVAHFMMMMMIQSLNVSLRPRASAGRCKSVTCTL